MMTAAPPAPTPMPAAPRALRLAHRLLLAAALVVMLFYFAVYAAYAINLINFPFDYDQGEGFELVDTVFFSRFEFPYRDTEVFPFYSSNYPPLFHVIAAPLVWLFGPAYWYGRLLGFLGTCITAAAIAFAVYRDGQRRAGKGHLLLATIAALCYLASNTVYHIGPLFRQHATMVMFETLAVVLLAGANEIGEPRLRRRALFWGLLLVIAAGYTKQLAAVTALAVGLFLLLRSPRRALVWGSFAAAVGVGIFVWMTLATEGQWWRQAILANVNQLDVQQTIALARQWVALHGFLLVPALLLLLYELYFDRMSLYALWFLLAAGINGAASGAWGAGDSYFATSIAAACILSGIFFSRSVQGTWSFPDSVYTRRLIAPLRRYNRAFAAAALLLVPLLLLGYGRAVLHLPTDAPVFREVAALLGVTPNARNGFYDSARTQDGQFPGGYADIGHWVTQADIDAGWQIVALVQAVPTPVMSEDAGFTLQAGRGIIGNPTQLLNLDLKGLYDGGELIGMLERREFGLIILRAQFYPQRVLVAIAENYAPTEEVQMNGFNYIILRPREPDIGIAWHAP